MSEPSPPPPSFAQAAGSALAPVAGRVEEVREQAQAGMLRIDLDAAKSLLRRFAALRLRAADLVRDGAALDTPMMFGDNWVARIMSERLRAAAVDPDGGATPVLRKFHKVLDDLEAVVRLSSGLYETNEEQAIQGMYRAAHRLGIDMGGVSQ